MNRSPRSQDGWAIVTAMVVMSTMLIIALAAVAFVDTEGRSSQRERKAEARLNLTEGVLSSELYSLSHNWPSTAAFPDCTDASTAAPCFTSSQLKANFNQLDLTKYGTNWKVQVRDDIMPTGTTPTCDPVQSGLGGYYSDATMLAAGNPSYDANKNCQVWVRAEGKLDGVTRIVVAKVRVDIRSVQFPISPFVAGYFNTGNNGASKVLVDGGGQSGQVRCTSTSTETCVDYAGGQIANPGSVLTGDPNLTQTVLDDSMIDSLRKTAQQNNTYYSSTTPGRTACPADPSGDVVFVEDLSCSYSSVAVNATTHRGIFVVNRGTLSVSGNFDWYGAIYAMNGQGCGPTSQTGCINTGGGYKDAVVQLTGTGTIHGGVYVDGSGRLTIGSSGNAGNCASCLPNLVYDKSVFPPLQVYGTAGIIQNTWRELTRG